MTWNDAKDLASSTVEKVKNLVPEIPKGLLPWEMDYSEPKAAPKPVTVTQPKDQFEQVFSNLIQAESRGQHLDASGNLTTSDKGARGITQVVARTGVDPGYGVTPLQNQTEQEYIRFGKDYLRAMLNEFGGDYEKALAAYNAGVGNVKKAVAKAEEKGGEWMNYLPKKRETLPYIRKILGNG